MTYSEIQTLILANLPIGTGNITAVNHRAIENALLDFARDQWVTGDIKEIDCNQDYILNPANFIQTGDEKGKGTVGGPREGWAICNGNNGTRNRTGRVSVAWGLTGLDTNNNDISQPVMNVPGQSPFIVGGAKTHTLSVPELPSHNHPPFQYNANTQFYQTRSVNYELGGVASAGNFGDAAGHFQRSATTGNTGGGGAHNNMQPYIVTLFIQKL